MKSLFAFQCFRPQLEPEAEPKEQESAARARAATAPQGQAPRADLASGREGAAHIGTSTASAPTPAQSRTRRGPSLDATGKGTVVLAVLNAGGPDLRPEVDTTTFCAREQRPRFTEAGDGPRRSGSIDQTPRVTSLFDDSDESPLLLLPVSVDDDARRCLCSDPADYVEVLQGLLRQDVVVALLLGQAARQRLRGDDWTPSEHVTIAWLGPEGSRGLAAARESLVHLTVEPGVWVAPPAAPHGSDPVAATRPTMWPALFVRHRTMTINDQVPTRLIREASIMSQVAVATSVFDQTGGTMLYQNQASARLLGFCAPRAPDKHHAPPPTQPSPELTRLFSLEPDELPDMLQAVQAGRTWRRVIKVPSISAGVVPSSSGRPAAVVVPPPPGSLLNNYYSAASTSAATASPQGSVLQCSNSTVGPAAGEAVARAREVLLPCSPQAAKALLAALHPTSPSDRLLVPLLSPRPPMASLLEDKASARDAALAAAPTTPLVFRSTAPAASTPRSLPSHLFTDFLLDESFGAPSLSCATAVPSGALCDAATQPREEALRHSPRSPLSSSSPRNSLPLLAEGGGAWAALDPTVTLPRQLRTSRMRFSGGAAAAVAAATEALLLRPPPAPSPAPPSAPAPLATRAVPLGPLTVLPALSPLQLEQSAGGALVGAAGAMEDVPTLGAWHAPGLQPLAAQPHPQRGPVHLVGEPLTCSAPAWSGRAHRNPSAPVVTLSDLSIGGALATSGWRHARVRTLRVSLAGGTNRDGGPAGAQGASVVTVKAPRVALLSCAASGSPSGLASASSSGRHSVLQSPPALSALPRSGTAGLPPDASGAHGTSSPTPLTPAEDARGGAVDGVARVAPLLPSPSAAADGAAGGALGGGAAPSEFGQTHEDRGAAPRWLGNRMCASLQDFCMPPPELLAPNATLALAYAYHDVCAMPFHDPVQRASKLLLLQTDVTMRVEAEKSLAEMADSLDRMLGTMFPKHALCHMLRHDQSMGTKAFARSLQELTHKHCDVTVFFMDVCGFTEMAKQVEPHVVLTLLGKLFQRIDALVDSYESLFKVETAGDAYLVAGNLMRRDPEDGLWSFAEPSASERSSMDRSDTSRSSATTKNASSCEPSGNGGGGLASTALTDAWQSACDSNAAKGRRHTAASEAAIDMFCFSRDVLLAAQKVLMPHSQMPVRVRIGLHTGNVVSGVIGTKLPKFGLFGDTMNSAARMEQTSKPGCIQMTAETRALLPADLNIPSTGGLEVKGKGFMETFLYDLDSGTIPSAWFAQQRQVRASRRLSRRTLSTHSCCVAPDSTPTRSALQSSTSASSTLLVAGTQPPSPRPTASSAGAPSSPREAAAAAAPPAGPRATPTAPHRRRGLLGAAAWEAMPPQQRHRLQGAANGAAVPAPGTGAALSSLSGGGGGGGGSGEDDYDGGGGGGGGEAEEGVLEHAAAIEGLGRPQALTAFTTMLDVLRRTCKTPAQSRWASPTPTPAADSPAALGDGSVRRPGHADGLLLGSDVAGLGGSPSPLLPSHLRAMSMSAQGPGQRAAEGARRNSESTDRGASRASGESRGAPSSTSVGSEASASAHMRKLV